MGKNTSRWAQQPELFKSLKGANLRHIHSQMVYNKDTIMTFWLIVVLICVYRGDKIA